MKTYRNCVDRLAVHIVAYSPQFLKKEDIPESAFESSKKKEIEIGNTFDPESFVREAALLEQEFVLGGDEGLTVQDAIQNVAKKNNVHLRLSNFIRWERGEGLVKNTVGFRDQVAAILKQF